MIRLFLVGREIDFKKDLSAEYRNGGQINDLNVELIKDFSDRPRFVERNLFSINLFTNGCSPMCYPYSWRNTVLNG